MNNGKEVCKRLKKVRREIADANEIPLIQEECTHEGDCMGTCPRCEQEVKFLENKLSERKRLGKAVAIVGIAASTACTRSKVVSKGFSFLCSQIMEAIRAAHFSSP